MKKPKRPRKKEGIVKKLKPDKPNDPTNITEVIKELDMFLNITFKP